MPYRIRPATIADVDVLVRQRVAMFTDMGTPFDAPAVARAFRAWIEEVLPQEQYRAWVAEESATIVAGAAISVLPWPPGPFDTSGRIAFVYNVYTEAAHRHRGLARRLMSEIHAWCRSNHVRLVGLAASPAGRPLYDSLGYREASNPYLFLVLE